MNLIKKIIASLVIAASAIGGYVGINYKLGATKPAGLFTYRLAGAGISSSATSFTLSSLTLPQTDYPIQDTDLSDTFYLTFEPGNVDRQEFLSCTTVGANTGSTVNISGCTRGLSPITPYTASTTLQFVHPAGSAVIFSDAPGLLNEFAQLQNTNNFTGIFTVSTTTDGDLSSPQTRIYLGGGSSTTTSAYIWLNRAAGTMGFRTASQAELAFATGGTTFTVVNPITSVSSELKLATSTYDFTMRDSTLLGLASTTIASGKATGTRLDDLWNNHWNATTTREMLTISSATTTILVVGNTQPTATHSLTRGLWFDTATSTLSVDIAQLCWSGTDCMTTAPSVMATSTILDGKATSGTGETSMFSYTLPGGLLGTGKKLRVAISGRRDNTNQMDVRVKYGGTTFCDYIASANADWAMQCDIVASAANTQTAYVSGINGTAAFVDSFVQGTVNVSTAQTLQVTVQNATAGASYTDTISAEIVR